MNRLINACAVVCLLTFFLDILPDCLGSAEEVLTTSTGNVSVDEVISHRQSLGTNSEVTEKANVTDMLMQSDQSFPDDPEVICGDDSINVRINYKDADNLRVLAPDGSPVSLSQLPDHCKTSYKILGGSVFLVSGLNGCFVQQQASSYVLDLLWFGRRIQTVCARDQPPLIVCKRNSMHVMFYGENLEERLLVNVNGRWVTLRNAPVKCGFDVSIFPEMLSLSAPFYGCGMTRENGVYTLIIQSAEKEMSLSCEDHGLAHDWFDPQSLISPQAPEAPQDPQAPKCECPCSKKPLETQVQPALEAQTSSSSPVLNNPFQHMFANLPQSGQYPTVNPPSQITISKPLEVTKRPQEPQFRPQFQPQIRLEAKEFAKLLSPSLQNALQNKFTNLPQTGQIPTIDPPSQTTIPKILKPIAKPPQEPQFQPQIRQGVKDFVHLLSPALQKAFQNKFPTVEPPSQATISKTPPPVQQKSSQCKDCQSKDLQMPQVPTFPPTEPPASTKGKDPPPPPSQRPSLSPFLFPVAPAFPPRIPFALSWYKAFKPNPPKEQQNIPDPKLPTSPPLSPKDLNMPTFYWPDQNGYAAVFVNPFLHPSAENWQAFMSDDLSPFEGPLLDPEQTSQYHG